MKFYGFWYFKCCHRVFKVHSTCKQRRSSGGPDRWVRSNNVSVAAVYVDFLMGSRILRGLPLFAGAAILYLRHEAAWIS